MPNTFPAKDRTFINKLSDDLHLSVTWDEYDENDENLVTWRFPGELEEPVPENSPPKSENGEENGDDDDDAWEDEDDEESRAAVDRVLQKYEKVKVQEEDKEGDFDARYEMSIKEKMDEWKRGYYKVRGLWVSRPSILTINSPYRASLRYHTTTRSRCSIWCIATSRVCSGSCTTTTVVSRRGVGSTIITIPHVSLVRIPPLLRAARH